MELDFCPVFENSEKLGKTGNWFDLIFSPPRFHIFSSFPASFRFSRLFVQQTPAAPCLPASQSVSRQISRAGSQNLFYRTQILSSRSLKSVLVLLAQILGPFGPPKKRVNFDNQKCVLCILTTNHLKNKLLLPYCVLFNK